MKKIIKVNWNSIESMSDAVIQKRKLENDGYTLVSQTSGFNTAELIYEK